MKTEKPTKISAAPPQLGSIGATSAPDASRQTDTRVTSRSSSAHPVKGSAPVTPTRLSVGVSTVPNGAEDVPWGTSVRLTVMGGTVIAPLPIVKEIVPVTVPLAGNPAADVTITRSGVDPFPETGVTCSQGWLDVADHGSGASRCCVSCTPCGPVCETKVLPFVTAVKASVVLSVDTTGSERTKTLDLLLVSPATSVGASDEKAMTVPSRFGAQIGARYSRARSGSRLVSHRRLALPTSADRKE